MPVYTVYKKRRECKLTFIKKISGDVEALMEELLKICSNHEIKANIGCIVIHGSHKPVIENYLMRLGF